MAPRWSFDRHLRFDALTDWLRAVVDSHRDLATLESYGTSHEGRELWLVTITDRSTGEPDTKPAHWTDASIHAVELTATVAACSLIQHLLDGYRAGDERVVEALRTRTFYVAPRVNPDGAEWVLAERPRYRRSSTRPWPWRQPEPRPGLTVEDVDGDGRVLEMRVADPDGGWMPHPEADRLLVPVPVEGCAAGTPRYRLLREGRGIDLDGWTLPTPAPPEALDLNRNFPAGWSRATAGGGDHPLSEPEIDALVRAIVARPNICGYNALHTSGGVLLRPSSTRPDAQLEPFDVWAWGQLGELGNRRTGYPVHAVFEDFTWDPRDPMSGASDDWAYDHLGIFGWTTEFWDVVHAASGERSSTKQWFVGPSDAEQLAVLRWVEAEFPEGYVDWYPFAHPDLGPVELGGWHDLHVWVNPPPSRLAAEVAPHAEFAVDLALASPRLVIGRTATVALGADHWRVEVGVANVGWLATTVTALAAKADFILPVTVELEGNGFEIVDGPSRRELGQLDGRSSLRFRGGQDGTPERALATWVVRGEPGTELRAVARHLRAGSASGALVLGSP
ncbi:MAG: M14 family metallopeptidase [Acidimicrobiia bacterium]|nr:M14 family metallopeptidase [Acidimicrobiia bacterium]